ncbi:hypothetical protein H6F78_25900 [Coleofasciculus sp. FACHB-64]|uniref:hypothetical protein n=1 Tax=Cyanophyceae TaxID=3028117 RepID=UPI001686302D|nr:MULTISPECIES: hypothetical protein [unclassified Coleofasciculus]MBD1841564.1 hypothetical protein [Coleofasciculus sp. FACHB-501]MBD2048991.1 hypothetical protein [Coleofasciculus sp. FACHB-64]
MLSVAERSLVLMTIEPLFIVANATIFGSLRRGTGWANLHGQGLINRDGYHYWCSTANIYNNLLN